MFPLVDTDILGVLLIHRKTSRRKLTDFRRALVCACSVRQLMNEGEKAKYDSDTWRNYDIQIISLINNNMFRKSEFNNRIPMRSCFNKHPLNFQEATVSIPVFLPFVMGKKNLTPAFYISPRNSMDMHFIKAGRKWSYESGDFEKAANYILKERKGKKNGGRS